MSVIIRSGISANVAEVNSNSELKIAPTQIVENAGYVAAMSMIDSGSLTGTPLLKSPEISEDYRMRVGVDSYLLNETFNATSQNTAIWRHIFTTMTATMSGGTILLNSASTSTASTGMMHSTWRVFPLISTAPLYVEFMLSRTTAPMANQILNIGLFPHGVATSAPSDGVYFRYTNAGLIGVVNFNGVETTTGVFADDLEDAVVAKLVIVTGRKEILFWKDDILLGTLPVPAANGAAFMTAAHPVSMQFYNSGTVSGTVMQIKVASVSVSLADLNLGKDWGSALSGAGLMAHQGQNGGTMGTTALYSNSLAAGAGSAMTNTTAALGSGLGGQFTTQPTLAAGTDGIVCSYQNPAGGINQTPRVLYITGVRIQGAVPSTLTGGPVLYAYSLAFGHTAVSMATLETASFATSTTKAPRRIALGFETFATNAAAGTIGTGVTMNFKSPIVVNPSEFIAITAKNLGTVTSGGTITFLVTFDGYFE